MGLWLVVAEERLFLVYHRKDRFVSLRAVKTHEKSALSIAVEQLLPFMLDELSREKPDMVIFGAIV